MMAHIPLTAVERLADLRIVYGWNKSSDEVAEHIMKEGRSSALRQQIEQVTRGQRGSTVWQDLQKGIVMPFDVQNILKGLENIEAHHESNYIFDFVLDPITLRNLPEMTPVLRWEMDHEEEALSDYWGKKWAQRDMPAELVRPGMIFSRYDTFVGACPHAMVYANHETDPKLICAVILKCIHPSKATHPKEVEHAVCRESKDGKLRLRKNHEWYYEAQATMGVLDVDHCDLVIYTSNGISVKQVRRNIGLIQRLEDRIDRFIDNFLFPYLFTHHE